jgi:hypothetical protein
MGDYERIFIRPSRVVHLRIIALGMASLPLQGDIRDPSQQEDSPPVVTWLASYPRSGNTLLRIILNFCFGQFSHSIYTDAEFDDPAIQHVIGHEAIGPDPRGFLREAYLRKRTIFVKTHELPGRDDHPAIYILRDGRSSVVSHYHFLRDILHRDASLPDVIAGKFGVSWSEHVNAWTAPSRRNTLIVRYENLSVGNHDTLERISKFIGRPILREFDVSFDRLHARSPSFFRRGSDAANIAEFDASSLGLFEQLHGDTLRQMGYDESSRRTREQSRNGIRQPASDARSRRWQTTAGLPGRNSQPKNDF